MRKIVAQIEFEVEEVDVLTDTASSAIDYVGELLPELISVLSATLTEETYKGPAISMKIGSIQALDKEE
jgi:hypothetical protein